MAVVVAKLDKQGNIVKHIAIGNIPSKKYENILATAVDYARANLFIGKALGKYGFKSIVIEFEEYSISLVSKTDGYMMVATLREEAVASS